MKPEDQKSMQHKPIPPVFGPLLAVLFPYLLPILAVIFCVLIPVAAVLIVGGLVLVATYRIADELARALGKAHGWSSSRTNKIAVVFSSLSCIAVLITALFFLGHLLVLNKDVVKVMNPFTSPPARVPKAPRSLESRLDSALAIQDVVFRNTVLTDVAEDAARDKNVEVVKKAIAGITDTKLHDTAAHSCAMTLWVSHQREAAKEVAKTITDQSERDDLLQFLPMSDSLVPRLPPHPATFAPAGSNRSGDGGNEIAEAFDGKGREAAPH